MALRIVGRVLMLGAWMAWRLVPVLIRAAAVIVMIMITSTIALVVGVPESTDRIAREWQKRINEIVGDIGAGIPIYWLLRGTVFLMLVIGWLLIVLTAAAILNIIGLL